MMLQLRRWYRKSNKHHCRRLRVSNCGYIICIMAIYWMTEACPLAVTSLLPIFLFPLFGIQSADEVSMNYTRQIVFLLVGTFALCIAVEEWNLHKRFALRALMLFGSRPCWIMLGLMFITAFLSMWLSNSSTSALMLPIAQAVYEEIVAAEQQNKITASEESDLSDNKQDSVTEEEEETLEILLSDNSPRRLGENRESESDLKLKKAVLLSVVYAANIGGIITTVGTPTNLVAIGILDSIFSEEASKEVNFMTWMYFCLPVSLVCLLLSWLWIQVRWIGLRQLWAPRESAKGKESIQKLIRKTYNALESMSFGEIWTLIHFLVLIALWLLREPKFFPGWKSLTPHGYALDSTAAVLVGVSILLFPSKSSSFSWLWRRIYRENAELDEEEEVGASPSLLTWETFQRKFPWDVMIMLGSGFALAGGCEKSGLSEWFGQQLTVLAGAPTWVVLLVVSLTMSILTEFFGNVATTSIILPILLRMAMDLQINPLLILFATAIPASFAFCLPISTPPNALAFTFGSLRIIDMASTGIVLNFVCVLVFNVFLHLYGGYIFHFDEMPEWAMRNTSISTALLDTTVLPLK